MTDIPIVYCGKCGKERPYGRGWLDPTQDIKTSKSRWCRDCFNDYYLENDRWKGKECPTCGQQTEEYDYCGYMQSKGETCRDPNCRRCLGDRALTFDVT